jgi:hypothetical protein
MLYNLNFLRSGGVYPQESELPRIKKYTDNRKLFAGSTELVYQRRFDRVREALDLYDGKDASKLDTYKTDINYHKLISLKTADITVGEPPTFMLDDSKQDNMQSIENNVSLDAKLQQIVIDVSSLGDAIVQVYKGENNKGNFIVKDPTMWTPIVDQETMATKQHLIVWIEDLNPELKVSDRNKKYKLWSQIHDKGYYTLQEWQVKSARIKDVIAEDGERLGEHLFYELGELLSEKRVETGLKDFAIVHFKNITTSNSVYGIDDYEAVTPIIAEIEIRLAIEQLILDKHSHPTPYLPASAYYEEFDKLGKSLGWKRKTGEGFILEPGQQAPGYMEFTGQLTNNHIIIERLKQELFSLSEMGGIIDDSAFGASQGYEALETRLVNARMKARRLANKLNDPLKKLIMLLSQLGYKEIKEEDFTIFFNDGIPNNEYRNTQIAQLRVQSGLISKSTALQEYYNYSKDKAEEEVEKINEETSDSTMSTLGLQRSNL